MKTLVVLSALASVALAAPSYLVQDHKQNLPQTWPEFIRRDKKSPQGYFYAESAPFSGVSPVHTEAESDHSPATGRSFGFKKPLKSTIISRPTGYHVYRDSSEERAQENPSEECSKQVKVKFCDGDKATRSIKEQTHEDDVESSIKMAKEAIEHLQRDLKNIENGPKSAAWGDRDVMQEDIETARKVLEHVHKNFGNLESMSLHSTLADEKPSHHISETTHEERAAQWKDHTKSFKNNAEGARNMEDIMQSPDQLKSSLHVENIDTTKLMKNSEKSEHLLHEAPLKPIAEELKETHERHASTETKIETDMKPSETKMEHSHQLIEKSAESTKDILKEEKTIEHQSFQGKASDLLANTNAQVKEEDHKSQIDGQLRATENNQHIHLNKPGSADHLIASADLQGKEKINTNDLFRKSSEHEWNHDTEKHLKQPKHSFIETDSMDKTSALLKNKQTFDESSIHEKKSSHSETSMKSAEHEDMKKTITEHHEIATSEKLTPIHLSSEKSADSMELGKDKIESQMRWAPAINEQLEKTTQLRASTELHNQQIHPNLKHHHIEPTVESSNHMDMKTHPHAHPMKIHEHEHAMNHAKSADLSGFMSPDLKTSMIVDHAKSADFNDFTMPGLPSLPSLPNLPNLPSLPSNMIDFAGKSAMDMMQWTHKTDGGRSAYGAYGGGVGSGLASGSGGSGAVGVFPNAHVGGCAVPLLLSCSPSVVSGSLAKSGYGPSYGAAPAYRGVEDLNFHNKRDTKKIKEGSKKNIKHRTIAEKKQ